MAITVLEKLWTIAQTEAEKHNTKSEYVFSDIGLFLLTPPTNSGIYPTPINTSTFAETRGDSVHYGLLHINGKVTENSPVIMTVPCSCDKPNFVLGENLLEFLCLGCEVGYGMLEQLAYGWEDMVDYLSRPDHPEREDRDEDAQENLDILTNTFYLKPWKQVQGRLEQLDEKYRGLLELPPEPCLPAA